MAIKKEINGMENNKQLDQWEQIIWNVINTEYWTVGTINLY